MLSCFEVAASRCPCRDGNLEQNGRVSRSATRGQREIEGETWGSKDERGWERRVIGGGCEQENLYICVNRGKASPWGLPAGMVDCNCMLSA